MSRILGLSVFHPDASAAAVVDGRFVAGVEEERFRRIKHWAGFPERAIRFCLEEMAGGGLAGVTALAVARQPRAYLARKAMLALSHPRSLRRALGRARNLRQVASLEERIAGAFGGPAPRLHAVEHHLAHVASAFYCSPFEEAMCLSVDGFGDFVSTLMAVGRGNRIEVLDRVHFPHSLGLFYTAVTQFLGFPGFGDEYKVMGLAAYGEPAFAAEVGQMVPPRPDGTFVLDLRYFRHLSEGVDMTWEDGSPELGVVHTPELARLLGPPRRPGEELTQRHKDLATSLQQVYEERFFALVRALQRRTGLKRLALAGGCAMNSLANGKLFDRTDVGEVYIQSAAGDAGTALGAALHVHHGVLGAPRNGFVMEHSYWGPAYGEEAVRRAIAAALPASGGQDGVWGDRCRDRPRRGAARRRDPRGDRRRRRGRLVPGALRMGPPRARQPLDPGRPPAGGHEGDPQPEDQAPGVVPPLRPLRPGGADGRVVHDRRPRPVHDQGLPDPAGEAAAGAGGDPRRRHRPAADRVAAGQSPLLGADRRLRAPHRGADGAQHLVQRERADRQHAGRGPRLLPAHPHGPAGAGRRGALAAGGGGVIRSLLERLSRGRVLRRRLPAAHGGHALYVSPDAAMRLWRRDLGAVDPFLLTMAGELVRPGMTVWDVGANVGLFAFAAAHAAGPSGRVLAVEADPWLAGLLQRSAGSAPPAYAPVEVLAAAVSDAPGSVELCIARRGRAGNHLSTVPGSTQTGGTREVRRVAAVTLDGLLDRSPAPQVVKIDTEGAELLCLRGGGWLLREIRPVLLCEVTDGNAPAVGGLLRGYGYTMLDAGSSRREPLDRPAWNTLALPEPRAAG